MSRQKYLPVIKATSAEEAARLMRFAGVKGIAVIHPKHDSTYGHTFKMPAFFSNLFAPGKKKKRTPSQ